MEYLHQLLEGSSTPFWSALILGLMTAISPCPMATNITAIGFISKNIENKERIFLSGLLYTLGRAFSYTSLGLILYFGASRFQVAQIFQGWGERVIGFLLILIGVIMLDVIKIKFPAFSAITDKIGAKEKGSYWGAFLLGLVFALAFCPYSGVLYFGMLIPMSVSSASGLYLPLFFAIATGLPVIIIAWILAYSVASIGNFYQRIKVFETWFRRIVAGLFILVGIYYLIIYYLK
ncbi:MAG TPA: aromatic aminobenezylarsenical efflux permease ArsG family transporter [Bacteroidales bacterium]|nr:aromatic aminobenezylarsenical efflux permease ArsG family transporter [Bacteroidales bacterium]